MPETMNHIETQRDPDRFIQIYRSTILQANGIYELVSLDNREFQVRLRDGSQLSASRTYSDHLNGGYEPLHGMVRGCVLFREYDLCIHIQMHKQAAKPSGKFMRDGSRIISDLISNKWAMPVFCCLWDGTKRFRQIQREIGRPSSKVLTQTLRALERLELTQRVVFPVVPPKVEYSLSPLGKSLARQLRDLCVWAERNFPRLDAAMRKNGCSMALPTKRTPPSTNEA